MPSEISPLGLAQNAFQPGQYSKGRHVRTQLFVGLVVGSLVYGNLDIQLSDWFLMIAKVPHLCCQTSDFTKVVRIFLVAEDDKVLNY
ncbi:hypothetical protein [Lactiplantibacillus pentosus]|uniref:hypothetical protein n=1 Tax=Lactiplantibacillus pentosus TaxID=1589 RepID=UPI0021823DB6|nr:hypothetical protein [Lactiplantibacillus pentosus]